MKKFNKFMFKLIRNGIICCLFVIIVSFLYVKLSPTLKINTANNLIFYDNDGSVFFKGNESKEWIGLEDISDDLINATISTEDKHFYKHFGFDFLRILKACYINIKSGDAVQGASTITQQYAKNLFLDFDKTWKRKWSELWYTLRIEANYSKDDILEGYLNTINYGHGKYGIENASKYYFNKSASDLSLAEATILSGIPKSPANYSPLVNYDLAKKRQLNILKLMVSNNYITEKEMLEAYNTKLNFSGNSDKEELTTLMYFYDAVIDELETIDSIPNTYTDISGLKIYTTLDLDAQKQLEKNIEESIPKNSEIQTASVMMNPQDGGILALVGGRDYNKSSYNRATKSMRQVGSTMKPYLYYAALESGFTTSSSFTSEATTFSFNNQEDYTPKNYNDTYGNKAISMAAAVAYSENIYAVKTHLFLGEEALINVARRVGITSKLEPVPSLPLGTNEISIIEMAAGYSAFANLGYKVKPHLIEKIVDENNKVLYQSKKEKSLVLNSSLAFILNNMLTSTYDVNFIDYNYPTAVSLSSKLTHTYALKSGTTNGDNWNIGYNSDVLCAVWMGYDDNRSLNTNEYKYSQNIWYKSIEAYEKDKDNNDVWYKVPKNVSAVFVDPISGKPVTNDVQKKKLMYFIKGTEPEISDPVFDEIISNDIQT
ncbi:MAG: PBP1A family penicillin-binding protein [Bacilli bacterium]|nr:PBP1A family penicillin-binding protein [Bacilli bacterium]